MKILFVSLLAGSAQGILAADADADDNADAGVPAASLRRRGTATNHANRRTNGYWAAPISDSGLTCIDNSIRAGGDKPAEICMTEGDALCIEYDHKPMGGRWQFGIKDSRLLLYDPKGDVAWEYCRDVTHLCIGEEHGFVPNRYSQERPYMTMYDEKSHEVVGSLTCDGTDGQVRRYAALCVEEFNGRYICMILIDISQFLSFSYIFRTTRILVSRPSSSWSTRPTSVPMPTFPSPSSSSAKARRKIPKTIIRFWILSTTQTSLISVFGGRTWRTTMRLFRTIKASASGRTCARPILRAPPHPLASFQQHSATMVIELALSAS